MDKYARLMQKLEIVNVEFFKVSFYFRENLYGFYVLCSFTFCCYSCAFAFLLTDMCSLAFIF